MTTSATNTYKKFADYYDLYVGNFNADLNCYLSFCNNSNSIVEVGCGTGRILKALLENNFSVTGIDISEEMLQISQEKLNSYIFTNKLDLKLHNFTVSPLEQQFSRAIVSFFTFNYIAEKPLEFLLHLRASLLPEGVVILDLFKPAQGNGAWHENVIETADRNIIVRDKRVLQENIEHRIQVYIENKEETTINTERRYFSPSEIKTLLKKAGYKNITFSLKYDDSTFVPDIEESQIDRHFLVKAEK